MKFGRKPNQYISGSVTVKSALSQTVPGLKHKNEYCPIQIISANWRWQSPEPYVFWPSVRLTLVSSWTADTPRPPAGRCQTAATPRQSRPKDLWPTQRRQLASGLPVRFSHNDEHESFLSPTFPKHFETWPRRCKQLANTPQPEVAEANLICATPKRVGFL